MVKILKGDLLESDCQYIAHGVNCQGAMNSGIAGQIRKKWPKVYDAYMQRFAEYEFIRSDLLGQIQHVNVKDGDIDKVVFNVFTQYSYGRDPSVRYVNYAAVYRGLSEVAKFVSDHGLDNRWHGYASVPIGIPWIGCGLANGEKSIVREILEMIEKSQQNIPEIEFHVYEFDG